VISLEPPSFQFVTLKVGPQPTQAAQQQETGNNQAMSQKKWGLADASASDCRSTAIRPISIQTANSLITLPIPRVLCRFGGTVWESLREIHPLFGFGQGREKVWLFGPGLPVGPAAFCANCGFV
jgi:hypothetical protein